MDQVVGKSGGDGGVLKNAESGWLALGGVHEDISSQFKAAKTFDFASAAAAAKHLNPAQIDSGGITFSAKQQADQVLNV
jgi:hypothetical protein